MTATIRMVAERAGVSEATVSRVLNGTAGVRAETRQKVESAIAALKFAPNAAAQGLRSGRTGIIGVVVPDVAAMFFMDIIKSLENTLMLHDYKLVICDSQNQVKIERENIRWLARGRVDGIILLVPLCDDALLLEVAGAGVPLTIFGRLLQHENISCVTMDNVAGAKLATQHLINHGHRRIALMDGGPGNPPDVQVRIEGYRQALQQAGIAFDPDLIEHGSFTEEGGARAMQALLAQAEPPTAVFCLNDEMALGAVQGAASLGLRVPEDVAVIGFDNIRLARMVTPALTTINQPATEAGYRLAVGTLNRLADRADAERFTLPCDLVVRHSCGC